MNQRTAEPHAKSSATALRQERIVFSPSVEALLVRGLARSMTPELKEKLKQTGIDLGRPLLPGYPSDLWQRAIEVVGHSLFPDLTKADAQWKLGESTVYGFEETLLGKAMIGFSRVVGPRRILLRFPTMSRASNNFSHMAVKEVSPTEFEIVCDPYVGYPEYVQGCLRAVLDVSGAKSPRVELVSHDVVRERIVLRATWRA